MKTVRIDTKGRESYLDLEVDAEFICSYCGAEHDHDDQALNCCAD